MNVILAYKIAWVIALAIISVFLFSGWGKKK